MGGRESEPHLAEKEVRVPEMEKLVEEVMAPGFFTLAMSNLEACTYFTVCSNLE